MLRITRSLVAVMMLVSLSAFRPAPQAASGSLTISTAYPTQEVRAGEAVSVSLEIKGADLSPQVVQLELRNVPEGWRATFQGGGCVVRSVFIDPASTSKVNLNLEFPDDAADGAYRLTVIARGSGIQAQLPLEFIVGSSLPPRLSATVDLPLVRGIPNSTFTYRLKVKNDSDQDALVNLDFEAPAGFTVTFRESGQEVTSVPIKAGQTGNIDVNVRPEKETAAGEYPIHVRVQSDQASDDVNLTAAVRGNFELSLAAPDGRLSGRATAGQETPLELILKNTGTAPASEVRLEASSPAQWGVTFEPPVVTGLAPDAEVQIKALIKPPEKAIAGDYMVTLRAVPSDGSSESQEFRITVETSTWWGVVGLVLIAAALGVVALAVARFGRR